MSGAIAHTQGAPTRIDTAVALTHVIKKVEPVFQADAVRSNPGAVIAADVVVRTDGAVESVRIITGPESVQAAVTAALRQWTFKPFMANGRPVRTVVMIDLTLPDPVRDAERKAADAYRTASRTCESAVATRASDAEAVCRTVVSLSEALEASRVLERAIALHMHGVALLIAKRPGEALTRLDDAIEFRRRITGNDNADLATVIAFSGEAHFCLGNIQDALERYASAIVTFERAIAALPSMRDVYAPKLATAVKRQAQIKATISRTRDANPPQCLGSNDQG